MPCGVTMKTRNSIKIIFTLVSIISIVLMARLFFVLMFNYYKEGAATTVKTFLHDAAKLSDSYTDSQINNSGILVLPDWQVFPSDFREAIPQPPTLDNPYVRGSLETKFLHSPEAIYYVLLAKNRSGDPVYVGKKLDWLNTGVMIGDFNVLIYWRAYALSIVFAATLTLLMLFVLRYLVTPLESLKAWAQTISSNTGDEPVPDIGFRFREFSEIADVISHNIALQKKSIRNEQEFLQFSSHELRSPLAVMKANICLLNRLTEDAPDKQRRVIRRIDQATSTMADIVNTFLWLSRGQKDDAVHVDMDLSVLLSNVIEENRYLVADKDIELTVVTTPCQIYLPEMPVRILLINIVSNAFKHACSGEIEIRQSDGVVRVSNDNNEIRADETNNTGFGLGLRLVKKIADRYVWTVNISQDAGQFLVEVDLNSERDKQNKKAPRSSDMTDNRRPSKRQTIFLSS